MGVGGCIRAVRGGKEKMQLFHNLLLTHAAILHRMTTSAGNNAGRKRRKNIMNRIPRTTMVVVTRYYANNSNMAPITHDPMTIAQAEKKGLTSTDSGTMRFKL